MNNILRKLAVGSAVVLGLVLVSEVLFMVNQKPPRYGQALIWWNLQLVEAHARLGNLGQSIKYLDQAALAQLVFIDRKYLEKGLDLKDYPENVDNSSVGKVLLENLDTIRISKPYSDGMAVLYYNVGLAVYGGGDVDRAEYFFDGAVKLAPEWSYFYIELTNYYMDQNMVKSNEVLDRCMEFKHPRTHCNDYKNYLSEGNHNHSVGDYSGAINEEIN